MENYQVIESQISDVRLLANKVGLKLPEDNAILKVYEEVAIFVTEKFKIPLSHEEYIYDNLGVDKSFVNLSNEIIKNNAQLNEHFSLELKLRGIGCIFSWGKPDNIELENLMELKYLIAKLHNLIGAKVYKETFASL